MGRGEPHSLFVDLVDHCRHKPGAVGTRFLGETVFRMRGRVFAFVAGPDRVAVTVKPKRETARSVLEGREARRARWIGMLGWLTLDVDDEQALRLAHELIDESYRLVATRPRGRRDRV